MQTGVDCAWRTRVTSFYEGAEAAAIAERGAQVAPQSGARPFRFEDLNGKPEPASWGPVYHKTASAKVEKWRMTARGRELSAEEKREYGAAVGEWIKGLNSIKRAPAVSLKYVMPDYAAKARAKFAAAANADKRAWALGQSQNARGETIAQAYERAMAEKRARLKPMRKAA